MTTTMGAMPGPHDDQTPPAPATTSSDDWPVQATRSIVQVVDTVRDKTSGPVITAVAAVVYGLVAAVAGAIMVVLVTVASVRGLELLLWRKVWLAYLVVAVVLLAGGLVCWSRRAVTDH